MKYEIEIRKLEESDFGNDCRFPNTDPENYAVHAKALLEDLNSITTIDEINEKNGIISIVSRLDNKDVFWDSVKHLFEREKEDIKFVGAKQLT